MKKIFLLISVLSIALQSYGQRSFILSNIDRRGFLNLTMGTSIPVGSPLKSDPNSPSYLMAYRGSAVQISAGYRLNHRFGVVGTMVNCLNDANAQQLISNAERGGLGKGFSANTGTWNCSYLTAGPYVTYTAQRWMFDGRVSGGYSIIQKPSTVLQGEYFNTTTSIVSSTHYSGSFTMGVGASVRYKIGRNFALLVQADYYTTRAKFKDLKTSIKVGEDLMTDYVQETKPLGAITINGGLSLLF